MVELRSGKWEWIRTLQVRGAAFCFRNLHLPEEIMRTWSPEVDATPAQVRELAQDPVTRTWQDPQGVLWELGLETPACWLRGPAGTPRALWLVFQGPLRRRLVVVPETLQLGELTPAEMQEIFRQALDAI